MGTIKLTLGVAELYDRALFHITDSIEGYVSSKQESVQSSISEYETQIEEMEARLDRKREMLINRFVQDGIGPAADTVPEQLVDRTAHSSFERVV